MRFAVIGDIHSNINALHSVILDIRTRDVDFIVSTGDLVGYLPFPNEVIDLMRRERILTVKGNHDQAIALGKKITREAIEQETQEVIWAKASAMYTNMVITDENRRYLNSLPHSLILEHPIYTIVVVHGSPKRIDEYLFEESDALEALHEEGVYDVVISGHTHQPYHREIEGKHYINVGSVGKPKHGDACAAYKIVSIEEDKVSSELVKVAYELESLEQSILGNPYIADNLVDLLKQGK